MAKKTFSLCTISKVVFTGEGDSTLCHVDSSTLALEVAGEIDARGFFDKDELPSQQALKPISNTLVMGLVTNIHFGAAKGFLSQDEHLEYIYDAIKTALAAQNNGIETTSIQLYIK